MSDEQPKARWKFFFQECAERREFLDVLDGVRVLLALTWLMLVTLIQPLGPDPRALEVVQVHSMCEYRRLRQLGNCDG